FWIQGSLDSSIDMTVWEQFAIRMRPTYLANSEACLAFIMQRHGLKKLPGLIYNGLRIPEEIVRTQIEPLQLLMVANFFPEKDHATVLRAFALLLQGFPDARLHFVGKSPGNSLQMNEMKALACDLRLSGKVIFHGPVDNVATLLQLADIGILSTFSEGLSNSLLEYMANGLPVVATDIAPNREALGSDNDPWLFTPGDAAALAALLQRLCGDSELRTQLGDRNRQQAIARFSLPVFNERFIRELNMALGAETTEAS
ncbi:MAG: glycosyltransferase family 4 protein, partial [Prosthecobacter sp.]|nr:glycosyltransferase family 4 protein [Prosthecobacter sp.]